MPQRCKPVRFSLLQGHRKAGTASVRSNDRKQQVRAPRPPKWLPRDAAAVWRETARHMVAAQTWGEAFATTLATFSVLEAQFRADIEGFSAAKLAQKRLLAADLGLAPATVARVQRVASHASPYNKFRRNEFDALDDR